MFHGQKITLLVVDDDEVSVMALCRGLRRAGIDNPTIVARDGQEALETLRGWQDTAAIRPFVVLLDLSMPRMDGLEFLRALRADPGLAGSVVFVLTTSDAPSDVWAAYSLGAAGYFVKDSGGDTVDGIARMIRSYTEIVRLPD